MQYFLLKLLKRCRIKIPHQPFLLDFVKFSVLSLILGFCWYIKRRQWIIIKS
ncbi:MAG TPA: hypothetical protein HPP56_04120 [Nitrospirae bacterium]|nr:hypothetical protein [Nitrospirota bacterium]